jgi:hypothetical protein
MCYARRSSGARGFSVRAEHVQAVLGRRAGTASEPPTRFEDGSLPCCARRVPEAPPTCSPGRSRRGEGVVDARL